MKHRHLEIPSRTQVDELPSAALVDLLQRGDLDDWRPLAEAIARQPFGPFAARLAGLLDTFPAYGTSPLWRAFIDHCRSRDEGRRAPRQTTTLAALRARAGLTQAELARRLGISQSDLSKLERRKDIRLSTLRRYATALGGDLRVVIERAGEALDLCTPGGSRSSARSRGSSR
jgi:DNA-binding Xre family transcriptional regulator